MKKTTILFAVLLLAILVLCIPAPDAEAAGHSDHTTYTAVASLPMTKGNYYLTKDVELTSSWIVSVGEIRLCLNGHTITQKGTSKAVIQVNSGGRLVIEDCSVGETGKITGGSNNGGVFVNGGEFALYGGHITGNQGSSGGVAVYNGGKAYLWGGKIHNNESTSNMGGGVYAAGQDTEVFLEGTEIYGNKARFGGGVGVGGNGTVKMKNGLVSNNTSTESEQGGAGVYVSNKGLFTMEGGKIAGNKALNGSGAGIFVSGKAIITGGEITGNTADKKGGGILKNLGATLVIEGGDIKENVAKYGGGIYSYGPAAFKDNRITDNTASELGGGVFIQYENPAVSGRVKIENNKDCEGNSNLYLPERSQSICVTGALDGDAKINITLADPPAATESLTLTSGLKTNSGSTITSPSQVFSFDKGWLYGAVWNTGKTEALVLRVPKVNSLPKDVVAKLGSEATFSVDVSGISVSYQWEYYNESTEEWMEMAGKTASGMTVTAKAEIDGRRYRVCISNPAGFYFTTDAKLTVVKDPPAITAQPKAATVALNGTATFSVTATGKGLSYQWQYSADGGTTWKTPSFTSTAATITMTANSARNGLLFRCIVKNPAGSVTSSTAKLTVSGVKPAIRVQPKATTVALNGTAKFSVTAAGTGLSYQWQYSSDGGKTWKKPSFTSNTATITMTATSARNGLLFRCLVTNSYGTTTSSTAKLTVTTKPVITVQPKAVTAALNGTAKFSVTAVGPSLTYQWQYSADGGKTWKTPSFTSNTATITMTATSARNGLLFRCKVTNSYGTVTSGTAKLTVVSKPVITAQPKAVTVALNGTAKFSVTAIGPGLSYQWQYSADGGKTWKKPSFTSNTATITMAASSARNGLLFRCLVTNSYGTTTSSTAKLTVATKPVITVQPKAVTAALNGTAKFSVTAVGPGLSYQWQYSADGGTTWKTPSFTSNTASITMTATSARNGLLFRCLITNSYGTTTSGTAKLTVK